MFRVFFCCLLIMASTCCSSLPGQDDASNEASPDGGARPFALRVKGTASLDENVVTMRDAIAFWSSEGHEMRIVFYPFLLTDKDIKNIRREPLFAADFARDDKTRNPDPVKWERTPTFELEVSFGESPDRNLDNVTGTNIKVNLERVGFPRFGLDDVAWARSQFQSLKTRRQGNDDILETIIVGEEKFFGRVYKWNFDLQAKLLLQPLSELSQSRVWTDITGKYSRKAVYVEVKDEKLMLRTADEKNVSVPLNRLSESDRFYLASLYAIQLDEFRTKQKQAAEYFFEMGARSGASNRPGSPMVSLSIDDAPVKDADLEKLKYFPRLGSLDLSGAGISGAGLVHLRELKELQVIDLSQTKVTDESMAHIRSMMRLGGLNLSDTAVSDVGLAHLGKAATFGSRLNLSATKITAHGLRHLKDLDNVRYLYLDDTAITDEVFSHLDEMESLYAIELNGTKVTGKGLAQLATLKSLRELSLENTEVGDSSIGEFKQLAKLRGLKLKGTKFTPAGAAELQAVLPKCRIEYEPPK